MSFLHFHAIITSAEAMLDLPTEALNTFLYATEAIQTDVLLESRDIGKFHSENVPTVRKGLAFRLKRHEA